MSGGGSAKSGSKYNRKYRPAKHEKWRNMDIEVANEALLKKMVSIVNVSINLIYFKFFIFLILK